MKLKTFIIETGGKTRDYGQIDPRLLQVRPGFNIRDLTTPAAREKLDVLKAQIKAEGVLEPLEIEFDGETPWINEGHRRHLAVMELIEESEAFKTIPCIQERSNIKADKRTLHMLMRKKEDYEPLEYAKGIDRMVNIYGWDKAELALNLGFKSKASIEDYLEMVAMPETVQEQVKQEVISATTARLTVREVVRDGNDPGFAAELIRKNKEENERLGVGKRHKTQTKVTRKTLERDKPPVNKGGHNPDVSRVTERPAPPPASQPTPLPPAAGWDHFDNTPRTTHVAIAPFRPGVKELIEALEPLANLAHDHDFNERSDDDVVEVPFRHLKQAWIVFAKVTGEVVTEDAA